MKMFTHSFHFHRVFAIFRPNFLEVFQVLFASALKLADGVGDMADIHRLIFETPDSSDDSLSSWSDYSGEDSGSNSKLESAQRHVVMNNANKQGQQAPPARQVGTLRYRSRWF